MNLITNSIGESVEGEYQFVQTQFKCQYPQLTVTKSELDGLITQIQASEDTNVIRHFRFLIDTTKFSDSWISCQELLSGMLTTSSSIMETMTTGCWTSVYDVTAWDNDPCCWELPAWASVCKPQLRNVSITQVNIDSNAIQST
jgi:hypothetical protein